MKINPREKRILISAGGFIIILLYYLFILAPAFSKINLMEDRVAKNQSDLNKMIKLKAVHDRYNQSMKKSESILIERGENFAILSYLESESRKLNIDKRIGYMKPVNFPETSGNLQLSGIEMNLVGINTKELVQFLHKIEASGKLLSINRIKIQRPTKPDPQLINVTLQVNTYNYTGEFTSKVAKKKLPEIKKSVSQPVKKTPIQKSTVSKKLKKPVHEKTDDEFITFIYRSILGVKPSAKHYAYWVKKLQKGKSREDVIRYFFNTDHYKDKNKNNNDFIKDLYKTILNRTPSQKEINLWIPQFKKVENRGDIINMFFDSEEYRRKARKGKFWFVEWLRFLK